MLREKQLEELEKCYSLLDNEFYSIDDLSKDFKKFVNAIIQQRLVATLLCSTQNGREDIELISYEGTKTKGLWYYWSILPVACGIKQRYKYSNIFVIDASNSNGRDILKRKIINTAFKCGSITKKIRDAALIAVDK